MIERNSDNYNYRKLGALIIKYKGVISLNELRTFGMGRDKYGKDSNKLFAKNLFVLRDDIEMIEEKIFDSFVEISKISFEIGTNRYFQRAFEVISNDPDFDYNILIDSITRNKKTKRF